MILSIIGIEKFNSADFGYSMFCLDTWDYIQISKYTHEDLYVFNLTRFEDYNLDCFNGIGFDLIDKETVDNGNKKTKFILNFCCFSSYILFFFFMTRGTNF